MVWGRLIFWAVAAIVAVAYTMPDTFNDIMDSAGGKAKQIKENQQIKLAEKLLNGTNSTFNNETNFPIIIEENITTTLLNMGGITKPCDTSKECVEFVDDCSSCYCKQGICIKEVII